MLWTGGGKMNSPRSADQRSDARLEAERYFSVVKTLPDIVYRIDPDGIFLFVNDSVRGLGYEPEELIGEHFSKIVHPDDVRLFARNFVLPAYTGKKTGNGAAPKLFDERRTGRRKTTDLEIRLLLKEKSSGIDQRIGTVIAFGDVSSTGHYDKEVADEDKKFLGTLGIIRDITERKKSEELLKKLNRALKVVTECDQILVRATDERKLLSDICQIIVDVGGYKFAWVGVMPDDKAGTVQPVAYAGAGTGYLDNLHIRLTPEEREPVSQALLTRKPQIIRRLNAYPARAAWRSHALSHGYAAMIALPLNEDDHIFGTLNIYSAEADVFDAEEVKLLTELSEDVAYGIASIHTRSQHKTAAEELQNSYRKLSTIFEQTVNALASAVGKRDPYTTDHQRRVTALASFMGQELGLPEEQVNGIRLAGMLHDIGKLAVPSEILSKPTRLSEAEFTIIKTHPMVASEILKAIEFPWPISEIALQHHERIDGSGYPQGLTKNNILPETRILSVADVVEAISSHRPYRPAYSLEYTLEEISKNKGIIYDADAVDVCLTLFREKNFRFE
jgi:PAS domain S-box-containing protein/putative nucleotidyltransferase with HDIG domain